VLRPLVLGFLVLGGCSHGASEPPSARAARAETPAERVLAAAIARPGGAFQMVGKAHVVVAERGEPVETLDEDVNVERSKHGTVHARYANSREAGRELYVEGGQLWIRPLFGKFHLRPLVTPDEGERLTDKVWGTLAAQLELVLPWAKIEEKGGRVTLSLGDAPARPASGWRGAAVVERLSGELDLDERTVVRGKLAGRVRFERDGRTFTMDLEAEQTVTRGAPDTIALPPAEDSVPSHEVSSEWRERIELLSGIAPPPKKGMK